MQNQKAWFFGWEKERKDDDIDTLWELFEQLLNNNIKEETFNKCLKIKNVSNNLSFGLFWLDSDNYIALDGHTREYLKQKIKDYNGEELRELEFGGYMDLINKIKKTISNKSFYEIVQKDITPPPPPPPRIINMKNIILYGVPGIGKTYSHKKLIDLIESEKSQAEIFKTIQENNEIDNIVFDRDLKDRVKFITFHQSFGYEDFIEGFRPNKDGKIELKDGVFKSFCEEAKDNKDENYYFIIDEINRGNISKIFGELITLIEEDKRDTLHVELPYSKNPFSMPSNIYIIGTMNSTDKSIALIDIALRRRFTFLKMKPNPELVENEKAKKLMEGLNSKIEGTLGEDYQMGHSYFMSISNDEQLEFIKSYKIKPLLEEYFYGNKDGYNEILEALDEKTKGEVR